MVSTMLETQTIVNDFTIQVATVNGSGSQTSNIFLSSTIFRMGIPVVPKNIFPSNIAGLPTWYNIRLSPYGYTAVKSGVDIGVAMNIATWGQDVHSVRPGGALLYDAKFSMENEFARDDITLYPIPFDKLAKEGIDHPKLRKPLTNMIYVGTLIHLLGLDMEVVEDVVKDHFASKPKAVGINIDTINWAREWAVANIEKNDPFAVEPLDKTQGLVMIEGNQAAALGCMMAGCTVIPWYPITPASSLCESAIEYYDRFVKREDGSKPYVFLQAEDELAAAGMVLGAGWAGARAMTATSGPGISLMAENIGLAYYAEIPGVFFDVQRVGPSTGLPTRTQQCDVNLLARVSHGDTKHLVLIPSTVKEAYELSAKAFDIAERFQTPVFVMLDLDLGMNRWMTEPFDLIDGSIDRGKVLDKDALESVEDWGRYKDVDGDGIPFRTLPGTDHPNAGYFTRGSGHDEYAKYSELAEVYKDNVDRLARKYDTAREVLPQPEVTTRDGAKIGLIAFGTTHHAVLEALDRFDTEETPVDYLKLFSIPFAKAVFDFIDAHDRVYVVEQNRDAQMMELLKNEVTTEQHGKLRSVLHYDGVPISAHDICESVNAQEAN
jgi:2-oxoglutarate ferredoxin oxidoreductase subunit alpha